MRFNLSHIHSPSARDGKMKCNICVILGRRRAYKSNAVNRNVHFLCEICVNDTCQLSHPFHRCIQFLHYFFCACSVNPISTRFPVSHYVSMNRVQHSKSSHRQFARWMFFFLFGNFLMNFSWSRKVHGG